MSLRTSNLLIFISFFPIWYFKFKIFNIDIFVFFSLLALLYFFIFFLNNYIKNKSDFLYNFFIAGVIFFGIDNHLSLHREVTNSVSFLAKYGGMYYASLFLVVLIIFIAFTLLMLGKEKVLKIFTVTMLVFFIFSILDNSKSIKNLKNFEKNNLAKNKLPSVVIIFDEMSGMNSYESQTKEGKIFNQKMIELAKQNNLTIYENIFSSNKSTIKSVGSLLNFEENITLREVIKKENLFFENNSIIKNKLFDKFSNISVYQSVHLNYCNHNNVKKCKGFNPFEKKNYIQGFKDHKLTHLINAWKYDGSISSLFVWRILRQLNFIDVTISPHGEKASFPFLFDQITNDMKSKKFDLIIAHTLVPHKPYGYNSNCTYVGKRSLGNYNNSLSLETHTLYHNIDRTCALKFVGEFLNKIDSQKISFGKIYFLSDHGSRNIMNNPLSSLSVIYFTKEQKKKFDKINKRSILQTEFKKDFIK